MGQHQKHLLKQNISSVFIELLHEFSQFSIYASTFRKLLKRINFPVDHVHNVRTRLNRNFLYKMLSDFFFLFFFKCFVKIALGLHCLKVNPWYEFSCFVLFCFAPGYSVSFAHLGCPNETVCLKLSAVEYPNLHPQRTWN